MADDNMLDAGERAAIEELLARWKSDDEESLDTFGQHLMGGAVLSCAEQLCDLLNTHPAEAAAAPVGTTACGARACTGCRVCGVPSLGIAPAEPEAAAAVELSEADQDSLDALLIALWQCETQKGYEWAADRVRTTVARIVAAHAGAAAEQALLDALDEVELRLAGKALNAAAPLNDVARSYREALSDARRIVRAVRDDTDGGGGNGE